MIKVSKILIAYLRAVSDGWRVGVWLSSLNIGRLEETPPTCRIAAPARAQGENLGNGAETKRPPGKRR